MMPGIDFDSNDVAVAESIHSLLRDYPPALREFADHLKKFDHMTESIARNLALAREIENDLLSNRDVFDPSLVTIRRHRMSTTQGMVEIVYDGQSLRCYHDDIKLVGREWKSTITDESMMPSARRDFYIGFRTRSTGEMVLALQKAVVGASPCRHPEVMNEQRELEARAARGFFPLDILQSRAIVAGYLSGHPFKAIGRDVEAVANKILAQRYWDCQDRLQDGGLGLSGFLEKYGQSEPEMALNKAIENCDVLPELTASGAELTRYALVSEEQFMLAYGDWIDIPTGQEPFCMVAVNLDKMKIASYAEGDCDVASCATQDIFEAELLRTLRFHAKNAGIERLLGAIEQSVGRAYPSVIEALAGDAEAASISHGSPSP